MRDFSSTWQSSSYPSGLLRAATWLYSDLSKIIVRFRVVAQQYLSKLDIELFSQKSTAYAAVETIPSAEKAEWDGKVQNVNP